jgi:hypothetical protein
MKIEFKAGNYYLCTKDYIINKQLAFKRKHLYLCKEDGVLEGCNKELYHLDNVNFKEDIFRIRFKMEDNVNHPPHYTWLKDKCGIEVIDITRHMDFCLGNAIKYILRAGHKQEASMSNKEKEIEDLKKAIWYINDRIKQLGGEV